MKFKTTIILAIVAIIGAAYVFLYEKKQSTLEERYHFEKTVLYNLSADSIKKIKMIKADEPFMFEKVKVDYLGGKERWMMKEPIETRADESVINGFLSTVEFLENVTRFEKVDDKKVSKKDYGLDKPTFEITLWVKQSAGSNVDDGAGNSSGFKEVTFFIGDRVSTGEHIYLQLKGSEEVLVVADEVALNLDYTANGFRDKWLLGVDKDAVSKLEVHKSFGDAFVTSKFGEFWRMSEPVTDRCSNKKILEIFDSLKDLKIEEEDFINDDSKSLVEYGLDNPRLKLRLTQNGATQGVDFGHTIDNKVYAKRDGGNSVFLLKSIIVDELSVNPDLLRSRELIHFETIAGSFGVDSIEIKSRDSKLTIVKTEEYDWQITEPVESLADMDIVKELIEDAKDLRILEFVANKSDDLSKYGLQNPVFDFAIYKNGSKKPVRMFCGNKTADGTQCYVKRTDEDPIFTITSMGLYEKLTGGLLTFYDKLVLDFDKDSVKKLDIEKDGVVFSINKNNTIKSNWLLASPVTGIPDNNIVDQIVHDTSFLKAEKYVVLRSADLKEFGLDNPQLKYNVVCEKQEVVAPVAEGDSAPVASPVKTVSRNLAIGNQVGTEPDSNYYAIAEGNKFVFEIKSEVVELLESEIVSKLIQKFDGAHAKKLVLTYPDSQVVFARPEGVWKVMEPKTGNLGSRQIEFLVWMLSNLTSKEIKEYNMNNVINYGLNNPDVKAAVHMDDNSMHEVLASKSAGSNEFHVMSRNSNCIYTIEAEIIEKFINALPTGTTVQ